MAPLNQRIDRKALQAWRMSGIVSALVYAAILGIVLTLTIHFEWPEWIAIALAAIAVTAAAIEVGLAPAWRLERWRYGISEGEIALQYGILFQHHVIIPMARIQHVDTKQGPIYRHYGLASVTFATAAGSHEIPALTERIATEIRNQIAILARLSNEEL